MAFRFRRPTFQDSGFRNSGNFGVWNPQSWVLESGIQLKESRIPLTIGIQNPGSTEIQYLEYVVNGVEPPIQDCIGFQQ